MLPIRAVRVKPPRAAGASGAEETRTPDVLLAKEVLYQLSYGPERGSAAFGAEPPKDTAGGRAAPSGRFWTRTRDLCLIRAVL